MCGRYRLFLLSEIEKIPEHEKKDLPIQLTKRKIDRKNAKKDMQKFLRRSGLLLSERKESR